MTKSTFYRKHYKCTSNKQFQAKTNVLYAALNLVNKIKTEIQNLRSKFNIILD